MKYQRMYDTPKIIKGLRISAFYWPLTFATYFCPTELLIILWIWIYFTCYTCNKVLSHSQAFCAISCQCNKFIFIPWPSAFNYVTETSLIQPRSAVDGRHHRDFIDSTAWSPRRRQEIRGHQSHHIRHCLFNAFYLRTVAKPAKQV